MISIFTNGNRLLKAAAVSCSTSVKLAVYITSRPSFLAASISAPDASKRGAAWAKAAWAKKGCGSSAAAVARAWRRVSMVGPPSCGYPARPSPPDPGVGVAWCVMRLESPITPPRSSIWIRL